MSQASGIPARPEAVTSQDHMALEDQPAAQDSAGREVPQEPDFREVEVPTDDFDTTMADGETVPATPVRIRPSKRLRKKTSPPQVPIKKSKYQEGPQGIEALPQIAMFACVKTDSDGWFGVEENVGLGALMDKHIFAIKLHSTPRSHTFDHDRYLCCHKLTVMLTDSGEVNVRDDEATGKIRNQKQDRPWKGITVFYTSRPTHEEPMGTFFLDTPSGAA